MYSLDWHTCTFWTLSKIFEKDNHGVLINHSSLDIPHTQHIYPIVLYKKNDISSPKFNCQYVQNLDLNFHFVFVKDTTLNQICDLQFTAHN